MTPEFCHIDIISSWLSCGRERAFHGEFYTSGQLKGGGGGGGGGSAGRGSLFIALDYW